METDTEDERSVLTGRDLHMGQSHDTEDALARQLSGMRREEQRAEQ